MRLIDADALQEALTRKKAGVANQRWTEGFNAAISKARSMVSCAKTIDAEPIRATMSEWISVKARMPEAEKSVIVFCNRGNNNGYVCAAVFEPEGLLSEKSLFSWDFENLDEYDEEQDDYLVNPGWYEHIYNWGDFSFVKIYDEVTHWMPLPEPPNEG